MIYAGIGSRETPPEIQALMQEIACTLAYQGHTLRSGHADGADYAFEVGANRVSGALTEVFLPWYGYGSPPLPGIHYVVPSLTQAHLDLAEKHHPAWHRCSPGARKLHARNGCQILGLNLDHPADLVICWTRKGLGGGGTGQALRIAETYGIQIMDLGHESVVAWFKQWLSEQAPVESMAS